MSREKVIYVFKDVVKALILFVGLRILIGVLSYLYMFFSLESLKIELTEIGGFGEDSFSDPERVYNDVSFVLFAASFIPMPLAFFYTFFSLPPKELRHVFLCAVTVSLMTILLKYALFLEINLIFTVTQAIFFIFLPWACSLIWMTIRDKNASE